MPNTYLTSSGERVTQGQIKRRMHKAKDNVLQAQRDDIGYNVCIECMRNDCKPVDCSHDISVKEAKETGRTELAWDENNIKPRGRECHQKLDKLILKFQER